MDRILKIDPIPCCHPTVRSRDHRIDLCFRSFPFVLKHKERKFDFASKFTLSIFGGVIQRISVTGRGTSAQISFDSL